MQELNQKELQKLAGGFFDPISFLIRVAVDMYANSQKGNKDWGGGQSGGSGAGGSW